MSQVFLRSREEYEAVVRVLEARGAWYTPWRPSTLAGHIAYCGNVLEDAEVRALLGDLEGRGTVGIYTWRPLLFPSHVPWAGTEWRIDEWGLPIPARNYVSMSTALLVGLASLAAGLYSAWRLGKSGKLWHFIVPWAVAGLPSFGAVAQLLALAWTGLASLALLPMFLAPPALLAAAFFLAWRRRRG